MCESLIVYILLNTWHWLNRHDVRKFITWIEPTDWIPWIWSDKKQTIQWYVDLSLYLLIKSQWLSHSWIYVTLQQTKHCYKVHFYQAYVKYEYNHILNFHSLKKHTKYDLIASFVYNPAQRLIPCYIDTNTIDCSMMQFITIITQRNSI